jgi:hypothetical protein
MMVMVMEAFLGPRDKGTHYLIYYCSVITNNIYT